MLVRSLQLPRGEDTGCRHLGVEVNAAAVESARMGKPQFENPKHSCRPLTYSDTTSNKDHKPKVNVFTQNNSSQTIRSVRNDSITYTENQENKDRHACGLKEEQTTSC